jgi:hypothetical protein
MANATSSHGRICSASLSPTADAARSLTLGRTTDASYSLTAVAARGGLAFSRTTSATVTMTVIVTERLGTVRTAAALTISGTAAVRQIGPARTTSATITLRLAIHVKWTKHHGVFATSLSPSGMISPVTSTVPMGASAVPEVTMATGVV